MNTPKVLLSTIDFSEQNVLKNNWYRVCVKSAVRCSLINFYAQRLVFQFIAPLEPWEGQVVADYNYRKVLEKVEREIPEVVSMAAQRIGGAQVLYDNLRDDEQRKTTLQKRYERLLWYDWRQKRALKKRIQKIDNKELELFDFLGMAMYLFEKHCLGSRMDFIKIFS